MSEEILIYVAGNPNLYPLEYYDAKTHTFQGSIPQMWERFAREYGYRVEYYHPQMEDLREDLASHLQVDLLSGCVQDEEDYENIRDVITFLRADTEGEETAYQILVTRVAPDALAEDLRDFAAQITQEEWNGAIIQASMSQPYDPVQETALIGLSVFAGMLVIGLAVVAFCFRQRVRWEKKRLCQDMQTGLPNQEYLREIFPRVVHEKNRILYYMIYIHVDLTHIERIGGEVNAREYLLYMTRVLREKASDKDVLIRDAKGGFAILMQAQHVEQVKEWGETVLAELRKFSYAGSKFRSRDTTMGIYSLQSGAPTLNDILFLAQQCAIEAGEEDGEIRIYDEQERKKNAEKRQILADFEQGIAREEFQLYLQPFVDAHTGCVIGGEMLIRWNHPQKGLLSADTFVPILEQEGRIEELDYYTLKQTCAFLKAFSGKKRENIHFVSCNFSRRTFCQDDFIVRCQEILEQYHFPREKLVLEITESEQEKKWEHAQMHRNIQRMREQGIRVIFDDFGIGFSSFRDLLDYPMDGLKLDKLLVHNMKTVQGRVILQSLIQTGHELGMKVLAEGIEESSQVEPLRELGCDILQGFFFSPPLPIREVQNMLLEGWKIERGKKERLEKT